MAKTKMDFKGLLLNHGEKIGAGVIALLGIASLLSANWSSSDKDPVQLQTTADNTKNQWLTTAWPADRQTTFADTPDVEKMAQKMAGSIEEAGKYATRSPWNEPLKRTQQKLQSVALLAPQSPEASLVIFPLVEREDADQATEDETNDKSGGNNSKKGKKEDNTKDLEELFGRTTSPALAGNQGDLPGGLGGLGGLSGPGDLPGAPGLGLPGESSGSGGGLTGSGGLGLPGSLDGYGSGPPGDGMGMMGGYGFGMEGGMNLAVLEKKKVRSHAGVSVRYIFNLYAQARQMAEALNLSSASLAKVQLVNFEVQRQRAIPGADPWAGEWETLPIDTLMKVLDDSQGFDMDVVLPGVIDYSVCMPLPRRAAGRWTPANASHKLLEEFQLSEEEQEVINNLTQNMREEAEKRKASLPPAMAAAGGFSRYSFGSQSLVGGLNNAGGLNENEFEQMFNTAYTNARGKESNKEQDKKQREEMEQKAKNVLAAGRLLLVRFMDFTCDRGTAYRYRVRLEMRNPLFNLPIDSLAEPEMASQPTVFSDWSQPTPPTFVPTGYRYYPEKAESRPRADEYAGMAMYYEHETAGTPLLATVRVPVGSRIGGKQSVEVVDLGNNSLELTEVDLKSQDYLAAVTEAPRLARGDFPELKDAFAAAGTLRPVGDRLTIVDANGAIVSRYVGDRVANGYEERSRSDDERLTSFILKTYDRLRPNSQAAVSDNPYDPYGGEQGGSALSDPSGIPGMGGMSGMDFNGGMREGSSNTGSGRRGRRGSMGGSSSGGMQGMPGMPGMPGGSRRGRGGSSSGN